MKVINDKKFYLDYFDIIKRSLLFVSLFYVILYVPLAICIYAPIVYDFNYYLAQDSVERDLYDDATSNLRSFFIHYTNLDESMYNSKEITHFSEVRMIYDILFILFILFLGLLYYLYERKLVIKYLKYDLIVILLFVLIIPFFIPFWIEFHYLLFDNDMWINTPSELSYYVYSDNFFRNSIIFIVLFSVIEMLLLRYYLIRKKK